MFPLTFTVLEVVAAALLVTGVLRASGHNEHRQLQGGDAVRHRQGRRDGHVQEGRQSKMTFAFWGVAVVATVRSMDQGL